MKTTSLTTKIERKTQQIDATNQSVGRLASQIALILRGKNKVNFSPQVDNGDFVVVANIDKLKFTRKKLEQKKYYRHSGYPGGLKVTKLSQLYKTQPAEILKKAVFKMLPKNRLRNNMIKRLTVK
jgi:large subunit ribosomal protein L13